MACRGKQVPWEVVWNGKYDGKNCFIDPISFFLGKESAMLFQGKAVADHTADRSNDTNVLFFSHLSDQYPNHAKSGRTEYPHFLPEK